MKLYQANILFTASPEQFTVLEGGYVAVGDDGRVEGTYEKLPERYAGCEVVDFGNQLLIPAMNDLHLHAPQYRNMGMAMDLRLLDWLQTYTFPEENRFASKDYANQMYRRFVHDLWLNGTMRSTIFATIHPEATMLLADMISESGMGAYVGLVGMDRNCPDYLQNSPEQVVADTKKLMEHLAGNERVKPIVTPRFVPSCTDEMMAALGKLAVENGLPVQSHLSENPSEIAWVKELEPESLSYGDAYYRNGLFGQTPTLMAHCCYTDGSELDLMQKQGVVAVHCPTSNCNIASGVAHVRHLLDRGVKVMLGSDISGGHTMDMMRVIQYTLQVSKLVHAATDGKEQFLSLSEAFWLATKSGGSFFGKVGSFEKGYEFDALVIDDSALNGVGANYPILNRLERHINLGTPAAITHRFCAGQELQEP